MRTNQTPKPPLFRRFLRFVRAVLRGPGDIDDRRNAAQVNAGKFGTYGTGDTRGV